MAQPRQIRLAATIFTGALLLAPGCSSEDMEDITEDRPRLEVFIDDNGIPHIYGRTDEDAFYGAGYQMASDRLFHMETTRRRAYGTLSEVLGQTAQADDELSRLFDFGGWGAQHAAKMQAEAPETYALISSWVDGVNARIAQVDSSEVPLPHGFGDAEYGFMAEPWAVKDVLTIATMTGFGNDLIFDAEAFVAIAFRLFPEAMDAVELFKPAREVYTTAYPGGVAPRSAPFAPDPARRAQPTFDEVSEADAKQTMDTLIRLHKMRTGMGSNNWAVSGAHTENGRPMLAGDPHLDWDIPGVFYALHINSKDQEGTIDAAGFSFVGTPGVSVGQTDKIVWTPTTAFADTMDVWSVQRPTPGEVIIAGQSHPVVTREEIIQVRGVDQPFGENNSVAYAVETVEGFGVIVPPALIPINVGETGDVYMMNWVGFQPNAFASILDFNRVESIDDYETAVEGFGGNFNFVAADANNITHKVGTAIPRRSPTPERNPWLVLDGDDAGSLWTGELLRPDELPNSRGGDRGFVVTANNDPFGNTADGDLSNDPTYFGAYFAPGWRASRAEAQLTDMTTNRSGAITLEDMQALQTDTHSGIADDLIPIIEEAWAAVGSDPALAEFEGRGDLAALVQSLSAWDRRMDTDSGEALAMQAYAPLLTKAVLEDDMELLFLQAMELQPIFVMKMAIMAMRGEYENGGLVLQTGKNHIALTALSDVAAFLQERFGGVDPSLYSLGAMRATHFNGSTGRGLDRGRFGTSGYEDTLNVAASNTFFASGSGEILDEFTSVHGPIFRHTATFNEDGTPELHFNMPLGNVAEPTSPHYQDLHDDWLQGRYRKFWYSREEVEEHTEQSFTLLEEPGDTDG